MTLRHDVYMAACVAREFLVHPNALPTLSWLATHPKLTNWDLGEPWWSPGAISYLATHLTSGDRVWEWGSGGSTVWLMERGARLTSVEEDAEWAAKVQQRCPRADVRFIGGADSGVLRSRQWERSEKFFDEYVGAVDEELDESLDVVIADGRCRLDCIRHAVPKMRKSGLIVIDDTEQPFLSFGPYMHELDGWQVVKRGGFKRGSFFYTETSFLHRMSASERAEFHEGDANRRR